MRMSGAGGFNTFFLATAGIGVSFSVGADIDPRTGRPTGDVGPANFAEFCAVALPASRNKTFFEQLEMAEKAVATGNDSAAESHLASALGAAYRGGAETDMSVKCFGEDTWRRWFGIRQDLYRLQAQSRPGRGTEMAQLVTAAANGGRAAVVELVSSQQTQEFRTSMFTLWRATDQVEAERAYGAFVIGDQAAIAQSFREADEPLRAHAQRQARAALDAEDRAFNRDPTPEEVAMVDSGDASYKMAQAMTGTAIETRASREALLTEFRVRESREKLAEARAWNLDSSADLSTSIASQRARTRGDALLSKANDQQLGLEARDQYYAFAQWYFEFGQADQMAALAESQRAAIRPALEEERRQQDLAMGRAAADMEKKAADAQRAMKEMQKTDAEKKSFNEEADALEAELGF
jgi:hypothetical protein